MSSDRIVYPIRGSGPGGWRYVFDSPNKGRPVDAARVPRAFGAGDSVLAIARRYGVTVRVVEEILRIARGAGWAK